jgi:hypothetical protein
MLVVCALAELQNRGGPLPEDVWQSLLEAYGTENMVFELLSNAGIHSMILSQFSKLQK